MREFISTMVQGIGYPVHLEHIRNAYITSGRHVVLTGATGWIGRALIELLLSDNPAFWISRLHLFGSKQGEILTDAGPRLPVYCLKEAASQDYLNSLDVVAFHFAFLTKDRVGQNTVEEYQKMNDDLRNQFLNLLTPTRCSVFVLASSGAVYDVLNHQGDTRQAGVHVYGRSKLRDEREVMQYFSSSQTRVIIPRIFNISGPYINKPEHYALSSFIRAVIAKKPVVIRSPKFVYRSFVYLFDLLLTLLFMTVDDTPFESKPFDTTIFPEIENKDLVELVGRILGHKIKIEFPNGPRDDVDRYVGDPTVMVGLLQKYKIKPLSLEKQIEKTAYYLKSLASRGQ